MFSAARFIVVDDKPDHLKAIIQTFQSIGSPCLGVHYKAESGLDSSLFVGVRVIFFDLHLLEGVQSTDDNRHFAHIASLLEGAINPGGGPFVLVIWTEHPQHRDDLAAYLDRALPADEPHLHPLAVLALSKTDFIDVETGDVKNADSLKDRVVEAVKSNPQLAALLGWEADVLTAAGATLSALQSLVPPEQRTSAAFPAALDRILSLLARESVGKDNVAHDPRAAINGVLAPILSDRILHAGSTPDSTSLWTSAITRAQDRTLGNASREDAARINQMLHIALPCAESIYPWHLGAVVPFPSEWWTDQHLQDLFGLGCPQLVGGEFKIPRDSRANCQPCLVRIGAACDCAQNRDGPITYLFGLEIPVDVERPKDESGRLKTPASEWLSPAIVRGDGPTFRLAVNARYPFSIPKSKCGDWVTRYRLREQLLGHLVHHASTYGSRLGLISF